ncbi:recombinase family protein, partial [Chloroflexota bacterium]
LRELVRNDDIQVVVVYCLDRISRDPTHGVILTQELEQHCVKLEAVTEDIDSSELGKLISYIRGFASKLEAEKIKERTTRGKRTRAMRGELPQGTGVGMYGYDWNKESKRREIINSEAEVVRDIFTKVATG